MARSTQDAGLDTTTQARLSRDWSQEPAPKGMSMSDPRLAAILAQMRWVTRPERFVLVRLHPRERLVALQLLSRAGSDMVQFIAEPECLTMLLSERDWRELQPGFPNARIQRYYRMISYAADLPDGLIGFLAAVTQALAAAGIPILAVCSFARDHILVQEHAAPAALLVLEQLARDHTPAA